jgi:hypothetical protein
MISTEQIGSPISRPVSTGDGYPSQLCCASFFSCRPAGAIAPGFSLAWLRSNRASHPSRSSGRRFCLAPALAALAAPEKRWYRAVSKQLNHRFVAAVDCGANPKVAHGSGDSLWQNGRREAASNQCTGWIAKPYCWLAAPRHGLVTRSSASNRRARPRAACGSTRARACARSP